MWSKLLACVPGSGGRASRRAAASPESIPHVAHQRARHADAERAQHILPHGLEAIGAVAVHVVRDQHLNEVGPREELARADRAAAVAVGVLALLGPDHLD